MALSKCPECNKEVSTSATICPHCGFPLKDAKDDGKSILHEGRGPIDDDPYWVKNIVKRRKHKINVFIWFDIIFLIMLVVGILLLAISDNTSTAGITLLSISISALLNMIFSSNFKLRFSIANIN